MPVMQIRYMRVAVADRPMLMTMTMRTACGIIGKMIMLMVLIMLVRVVVLFVHMEVFVRVSLAEVEPQSDRHEDSGDSQSPRPRFTQC